MTASAHEDHARPARATAARWRAWRLVEAAAVALFTLYVAWPFLRPNRFVTVFDTATYGVPNAEATRVQLVEGRIPMWNDLIFGGAPHLANPQAAVLYPARLVLLVLDSHRAVSLLAAFHLLVLAGGLVVLLSLRLRLRPPAAAAGTVAVVGSTVLMARAVQTEQLAVIAWLPWLLAGVDWLVGRRHRLALPVAATAVATGLLLVAGHPQQVYLAGPFVVAWAVVRAADRGAWRRLLPVAAAGLLGVALAAAQLLPTVALLDEVATDRDLTDIDDTSHLVPSNLGGVLLGDPSSDRPDVVAGGFEAMAGVGAVAVALAAFGGVHAVRRRQRRWTAVALAASGAVATVLAVGPAWPPFRWAFDVVPGFDQQRVPGRWLLLTVVAVALLAAMGVDALARRQLDRRDLAIAGAAVGAVVLGALVGTDVPSGAAAVMWLLAAAVVVGAAAVQVLGPPSARLAAAAAVVPVALLVVELGAMQRHSIAREHLEPEAVTALGGPVDELVTEEGGRVVALTADPFGDWRPLVPQLRPNANALFGVRSLDGYDGGVLLTEPWAEGMSAVSGREFTTDFPLGLQLAQPLAAEELAALGVRWAVVDTDTHDPAEVVPGWRGPTTSDDAIELWENPAFESEALVLTDCPQEDPSSSEGCTATPVPLARPRPGRVGATVDEEGPSVLAVAEQYADGWSATVDDEPAEVVPVEGFRMGVEVPPGQHRVRLTYRTPGLEVGLAVSAGAAVAVVALVVVDVVAWRRGRRRGDGRPATDEIRAG